MASYAAKKFIPFRPLKILRGPPNPFSAISTLNKSARELSFGTAFYGAIFTPAFFSMKRFNIKFSTTNSTVSVRHASIYQKMGGMSI